jgi:NAD(P)-dependent dehydrogenase (short-subunit alcohol dehydrogenase family)
MRLTDRVVIISGASGGLGQGVSHRFVKEAARVVLVGSRLEKVTALANSLESNNILPLAANLTDPAEAERVVAATLKKYGRVDILLNLAGGFAGGVPVHETAITDLQRMLDLNLYTTYNLCRAAVKPMIAQKWGRIVNTASRDALKGRANFSAYAISKAAVVRLTEAMAEEVKSHNITVNAILPGTIDTEANRKAMPKANFEKWVKPATIAETLLFLVSQNSAVNGAAIPLYEQV